MSDLRLQNSCLRNVNSTGTLYVSKDTSWSELVEQTDFTQQGMTAEIIKSCEITIDGTKTPYENLKVLDLGREYVKLTETRLSADRLQLLAGIK